MQGSTAKDIEGLRKKFEFTFGGAESVNYKCHYELAHHENRKFVSIWLTAPTERDLLTDPSEKLFWAQDIAMMTESFLRTAVRHGINLETPIAARPL